MPQTAVDLIEDWHERRSMYPQQQVIENDDGVSLYVREDLKQGLRMTLPGLYAIESAKNGGQVTAVRYPWE